ncbi:MAG: type II secretion system protein [Clostridia bacterium]
MSRCTLCEAEQSGTSGASLHLDTSSPFRKYGFTMIELIGAMIIIAVLTVAGITAVSTAIDNSRQTAIQQDLDGFRKVAEQFLLENPQTSKWDGLNSSTQTKEAFKLFNEKYLEGEMKFETVKKSGWNCLIMGNTIKKDPYGNAYDVIYCTLKLDVEANPLDSTSYARILIRSRGKNGSHKLDEIPSATFFFDDPDDVYSVTQFSDGRVISTQFTANDRSSFDEFGYSYDTAEWCKLKPAVIPGYEAW